MQLGIDIDLNQYRDTVKRLNFIYPDTDINASCRNFAAGNVEEAAYYLYVATFHQPEMAPPGMHSIKLECPTQLVSEGHRLGTGQGARSPTSSSGGPSS